MLERLGKSRRSGGPFYHVFSYIFGDISGPEKNAEWSSEAYFEIGGVWRDGLELDAIRSSPEAREYKMIILRADLLQERYSSKKICGATMNESMSHGR